MPNSPPPYNGFDAYKPAQMAGLVERVGVEKVRLPVLKTATLGLLAGAFIAFGAMFYTLVMTGSTLLNSVKPWRTLPVAAGSVSGADANLMSPRPVLTSRPASEETIWSRPSVRSPRLIVPSESTCN